MYEKNTFSVIKIRRMNKKTLKKTIFGSYIFSGIQEDDF